MNCSIVRDGVAGMVGVIGELNRNEIGCRVPDYTGTVAVHVVGQVVRGGSLPTLPVCPTWWHSIRITQEGLGN